jgi:DNA-binding response OmpR family regulator
MKDGKLIVLCVDDEQDVLDGLRMIVEATDFAVMHGARSGDAALDLFAEVEPDFVLIDLMMESIDAGVDAARKMHFRRPKVPIYMLTSVGDVMNETVDATGVGLAGVFQKPVDPPSLVRCMERRKEQIESAPFPEYDPSSPW